ncbi:MAG: hypothetical protein JWM44_3760 [Bacilli bacterium]|jgi:hypothetical protein|nr:hypothetical protein [Bacilli bacterium]
MRKYTLIFTFIGVALCLFHYFDFDTKNYIIFSFSIPLWFIPLFSNVENVNVFFVYLLTIASWTLLGYILDKLIQKNRVHR